MIDSCKKGNHSFKIVSKSKADAFGSEKVVRWCCDCGSIVVDRDNDGRTANGYFLKMQSPSILKREDEKPPNVVSKTVHKINHGGIDVERIREMVGVHPSKFRNLYMYGSRVYGNHRDNSDYDFAVLACTMDAHMELVEGDYNVHVKTPDLFKDELNAHTMNALECVFAPDFARGPEVESFSDFKIDPLKLKKKALTESYHAWNGGKRKLQAGEMQRGLKSIWHSLRILTFAIQILENGKIVDFSQANPLWGKIESYDDLEWKDIKKKFFHKKLKLEKKLKEINT